MPEPSSTSPSFSNPQRGNLTLRFRPVASKFISMAATGPTVEMAAFGTRGDGKTWAALGCMIAHAQQHHSAGYPLPTRWLGAADTFTAHVAKTCESLMAPGWSGIWSLRDDGHLAVCRVAGTDLVHLRLFGVEDMSGMDRLRAECHGLWFEEPAPAAVMVQSSGLSETAWQLGLTSRRLPTFHHPAIMTLNYPDEEHWTWQRFVVRQHPGSGYVRIPPGERASPEQRAEWAQALEGRPDLLRRLLEGQPGVLLLGATVAEGFNEDLHAPQGSRVAPIVGEPVWIGQDGGLTPTSVVLQRQGACLRCIGALSTEHGGMLQHVEHLLRPWLSEHVPWVLQDREAIRVCYDPAMDTDDQGDSRHSALRLMRQTLPATYRPGPVKWLPRREPLLATLAPAPGRPGALAIDPVQARGLVVALRGGWHYVTGPDGKAKRDEPVKNHPHSDYGDALCYALAEIVSHRDPAERLRRPVVYSAFDPIEHAHSEVQRRVGARPARVITDWRM